MKNILRNTNEDQTREVRSFIAENDVIEFEGKAITHGMLPEDLEKEYYNNSGQSYGLIGDAGAGKILPIKDKTNFSIKGGDFFNPQHAFETAPERNHHTVDELSFLDLDNCSDFTIEDVKYTGPHSDIREDTGYPVFYGSREFAHGIDITKSQNGLFKNLHFKNVPGDFLYFRQGAKPNKNISIIDCTIDFNGRQGVAWGGGENLYIDGLRVSLSGRGGADFEPPKTGYIVKNVIIKNSYFNTWLLPVPMGGLGHVENILIENNEWLSTSPNTYILADRVNSFRKNIIFRGNKRLSGYGTNHGGVITAIGVEGLLIENEFAELKKDRSLVVAFIDNCTNVTIRNCDFPNGKYIILRDTPIEEVKVYGNKQDLEFKIYVHDMPFKSCPDLNDFAEHGRQAWSLWVAARKEWQEYMNERASRATFKYVPVEEYTGDEPVYQDPDFVPYMGKVEPDPTPEPETPVEEGSEETPGFPEEEDKETPETEKVAKTWYQNKALWVIGGIALILIIIALL